MSENLHEDASHTREEVVVLDEDAVEDVTGRTIILTIEVLNHIFRRKKPKIEQEYLGLSFFNFEQ